MDRRRYYRARTRKNNRTPPDPIPMVLLVQMGLCVILLMGAFLATRVNATFYEQARETVLQMSQEEIDFPKLWETAKEYGPEDFQYDYVSKLFAGIVPVEMPQENPEGEGAKIPESSQQAENTEYDFSSQPITLPYGSESVLPQEDEQEEVLEQTASSSNGEAEGIPENITQQPLEEETLGEASQEDSSRQEVLNGQGGWNPVVWNEKTQRMEPPEGMTLAPVMVSAKLAVPVSGVVTSPFGYRLHPLTENLDFHTGMDIAAPEGTPIKAVLPGRVVETGESAILGNYLVVDHGGRFQTTYGHCSVLIAKEGMNLRQGERIALVGSTGISTGPHLHFEVKAGGLTADPAWLFQEELGS